MQNLWLDKVVELFNAPDIGSLFTVVTVFAEFSNRAIFDWVSVGADSFEH